MVAKSYNGVKVEWEMEDECRLHQPQQGMPQRQFFSPEIDTLIDSMVGHQTQTLNFMNAFSRYN